MNAKSKPKKTTKAKSRRWFPSKKRNIVLIVLFVLIFGGAGIYSLVRSLAATPGLYIDPPTTSVSVGSTFTVAIRLDPSSAVDGVQATLSYDPTVLSYVSTDTTTSAFPVVLAQSTSGNSVTIERGIFQPNTVSSDSLVANVTFKALAASSSTALQLSGNTTSDGTYLNPPLTGATVSVAAAAGSTDTTPPVVTITSPANGDSLKSKVTVAATATDNVSVSKMSLYIDGVLTYSTASSSLNYSWSTKGHNTANGNHTLTVKATDPSGNVGSASVTVVK